MTKITAILLLVAMLAGCAKEVKEKEPDPISPDVITDIDIRYSGLLTQAERERDPTTGWLVSDCDGMIWTGKYAASSHVVGVKIMLAQFPSEPGRFGRNPDPDCENDFSRDQGLGLITWAHRNKQLKTLEEHAAYGKANNWKMGQGDTRNIYTPQLIGHLYQAIYDLGGEDNGNRKWPTIYAKGLDDYQANLQMLTISFRSEADKITETMFKRIKEHAEREPSCGFYQVMLGAYTGDYSRAISILKEDGKNKCEYVRCDGMKGCQLAEDIWATDLLLRRIKG